MAEENGKSFVGDILEANKSRIKELSTSIWSNPEKSWEEKHACEILTRFLKQEGFEVENNFTNETAFRAVFETGKNRCEGGGDTANPPPVSACFLCQYDALPEVGHAAGHNLTTASSIAAAVCIKRMLEEKEIKGKVTVLGTPGEDCGGGGKIDMIERGAFDGVDFCLMAIPMNANILYPMHFKLLLVTVTYEGKAAHASAFPWEGRNALDAAVACYNNIALLRQQLKPTWMVNGIITKAGEQPNIIPSKTEMKFWLRAPNDTDMVIIQQKCAACFVAAAKATNTTASFQFDASPYEVMLHSTMIGDIYKKHASSLGMDLACEKSVTEMHIGSTDMGNVSQIVPCLCPTFFIGDTVLHSQSFHDTAGSEAAFECAMKAAQALALTASDLICSPETLYPIKEHHSNTVQRSSSLEVLLRTRQMSR